MNMEPVTTSIYTPQTMKNALDQWQLASFDITMTCATPLSLWMPHQEDAEWAAAARADRAEGLASDEEVQELLRRYHSE